MAKTFKTFNDLLVYQTAEGEKPNVVYIVSIVGTQEKELLRTPDSKAATKYFDGLKAQYVARAAVETWCEQCRVSVFNDKLDEHNKDHG